ncbi:MAG: zinc ribbon domain-containing protein [Armatimonadota bacterium]
MKCKKCGSAIPSQSKFCLSCGEPVQKPNNELKVPATPKKRSNLWTMLAALLIVAALATIIAFKGRSERVMDISRVPSHRQTSVLNAPAAPDAPQPGILQGEGPRLVPAEPESGPPADVLAYLEHVKKVEMYRRSMRLDLTPAFDMLKKAYSIREEPGDEERAETNQEISSGYSEYTLKWQQIVAYFNSVRAPESCRPLAGAYSDALGRYSSVMIKIQFCLEKKDLTGLTDLRGSAQSNVDSSLRKANEELVTICKYYGINRSFEIQTDEAVDSLLSPSL